MAAYCHFLGYLVVHTSFRKRFLMNPRGLVKQDQLHTSPLAARQSVPVAGSLGVRET